MSFRWDFGTGAAALVAGAGEDDSTWNYAEILYGDPVCRLLPPSACDVVGITNVQHGAGDGQEFRLVNLGDYDVTIKHLDTSVVGSHRVRCTSGADHVLAPGHVVWLTLELDPGTSFSPGWCLDNVGA